MWNKDSRFNSFILNVYRALPTAIVQNNFQLQNIYHLELTTTRPLLFILYFMQITSVGQVSSDYHNGTLRWRHNGGDSVSNHQPNDCLLNRLFGRRSK